MAPISADPRFRSRSLTSAARSRRTLRKRGKKKKKKKNKRETDGCSLLRFRFLQTQRSTRSTTGRSTVRDANFYADVQYVPRGSETRSLFMKREKARFATIPKQSRKDARFWRLSGLFYCFDTR